MKESKREMEQYYSGLHSYRYRSVATEILYRSVQWLKEPPYTLYMHIHCIDTYSTQYIQPIIYHSEMDLLVSPRP